MQHQFDQMETALSTGQLQFVTDQLKQWHPADVAKFIEALPGALRTDWLSRHSEVLNAEILTALDQDLCKSILQNLDTYTIAIFIRDLESDDAFLLLECLEATKQADVLNALPYHQRAQFKVTLTYPEDSAGRLMQREVFALPHYWTVQQALQYLDQERSQLPQSISNLFVLDDYHRPIGVISLTDLLKNDRHTLLSGIMDAQTHTINMSMDQEDVALLFRQYNLLSAPVVDDLGVLIGMITIDDVMDVMEEEAEEDLMKRGGILSPHFHASLLSTSVTRIQWLLITLMSSLLAAMVVQRFEVVLSQKIALAVIMPIVAAMGGNAGTQVITVTIRALALRELSTSSMIRYFTKELSISILNSCFFAFLLGIVVFIWFKDFLISFILSASVFLNIMFAGVIGVIFPILFDHFKKDPAVSSGPLLSTFTDIAGFAIFLGLASYFLM